MITARRFMHKLRWHPLDRFEDYEVIVVHRGALNGLRAIPCSLIKELYSGGFEYGEGGSLTFIPFHRIVEIRNLRDGRVVWRRSSKLKLLKGS